MKKALISLTENYRICEVVFAGEEFETTPDFIWIDCPDEITNHHMYDPNTNTFSELDLVSMPGFAEEGYKVARGIAYGSIGDQLDMMFKELQATGAVSDTGPWARHIAAVKAAIPKDDPAAVMAWNREYAASIDAARAAALPSQGPVTLPVQEAPPASN